MDASSDCGAVASTDEPDIATGVKNSNTSPSPPAFRIHRRNVGSIPAALAHSGRALTLSDPFRVLIHDVSETVESCYYDLPSHRVFRRELYSMSPGIRTTRRSTNHNNRDGHRRSVSLWCDRYLLVEEGGNYSSGFRCFDTVTKRSKPVPRSNVTPRVGASAVVLSRYGVYVIGGQDRVNNALKNNFEYLPWTSVLEFSLNSHGNSATTPAASAARNRSWHNNRWQSSSSSSATTTRTTAATTPECWEHRPPIAIPRHSATAIALQSNLYLIGGYFWNRDRCRYEECPHTEIFDGVRWSPGPPLNVARKNPSVVVLHESVLVVLGGTRSCRSGGRHAEVVVREIEVWDTRTRGFIVWGELQTAPTTTALSTTGTTSNSSCYRESNFSAIAQGNDVYLFCGGNRQVEKITLNIQEFSQDDLETAVLFETRQQEQLDTAVSSSLGTTTSSNSDHSHQTRENPLSDVCIRRTTPVDLDMLPSRLIPNPPPRPELPPSSAGSVWDRNAALEAYSQELRDHQADYLKTLGATRERIGRAYDQARDLAIEKLNEQGDWWMDDTERLIQTAQQERERLRPLVEREESFVQQYLDQRQPGRRQSEQDTTIVVDDDDDYEDQIPSELRCPITLNLMEDPVVAADGNTYDRAALEQWFRRQQKSGVVAADVTSPLTGAVLPSCDFYPVHTLRTLCHHYARILQSKSNPEKDETSTVPTAVVENLDYSEWDQEVMMRLDNEQQSVDDFEGTSPRSTTGFVYQG